MRDGPDIAAIAALMGDPARASMLAALMDGRALTASELAAEAGISRPTASEHLSKLLDGLLVERAVQGRHHYYRLAGPDVGHALEALTGLAAQTRGARFRPGLRDPAMRKARACYDHLAGDLAVRMFDAFIVRNWITTAAGDALVLTDDGRNALEALGVDMTATAGPGSASRRPECRPCLDWSERRNHLAGRAGAALLDRILTLGWARRLPASRIVIFSSPGERAFLRWLERGSPRA